MLTRLATMVLVTTRISARLQFPVGLQRHPGFWLAGVDAVLVHLPAAVGEKPIGMRSARCAVGFRQRITLPQFPHVGSGGVSNGPGEGLALGCARVVQQAGSDLSTTLPRALRDHADVPRPDCVVGRLNIGGSSVRLPRRCLSPLGELPDWLAWVP